MAAQRKRVLVASRQIADAEHAHQRFQLVGQRHHHTHRVARQRVTGKARLVVVFNRVGHGFGQAIVERVVAAHDALQLRELAHHVGHQIGLGQLRGLVGLRHQCCVAQLRGNRLGNRAHALHTFALRAQLVVVDHLAQTFDARSQRLLAVLVKEELGIGQARAHHALVAADHQARVVGADVADHQELVGQLVVRVQQREVLLVGLHRQNQALLRHVQELRFRTRRSAHWGARPARSLRPAARRRQSACNHHRPWPQQRPTGARSRHGARQSWR